MFKKAPRVFVYPYHQNSASAKALAESLSAPRIRRENSKFRPSPYKTVINWGASTLPTSVLGSRILNRGDAVGAASNKAIAFEVLHLAGVSVPAFTRSPVDALHWYTEGRTVFARHILTGHGGEGIEDLNDAGELGLERALSAPLFVEYIPKREEYRVHVFNGKVIDVQQKKLRLTDDLGVPVDPTLVNWKIRNHQNGFIFARNEIEPDVKVLETGIAAVKALDLLFGAVDVIWNEARQQAYALEVNTAPGLEGTTIELYTNAFKEYIHANPRPTALSVPQYEPTLP
jgi:glutathione synthase/RimK-type ligase-like ATP-grasp enzyme